MAKFTIQQCEEIKNHLKKVDIQYFKFIESTTVPDRRMIVIKNGTSTICIAEESRCDINYASYVVEFISIDDGELHELSSPIFLSLWKRQEEMLDSKVNNDFNKILNF